MTHVRYLILGYLLIMASGCFGSRSLLSLPGTDTLDEAVAILPVTPDQIIMPAESEEDYLKMAKKINAVLNTLAGRRNSKLIGPQKIQELLGKPDLEILYRIVDQEGDNGEIWKTKKPVEIGERLNLTRIIRVKTKILILAEPSGPWGDIDIGATGVGIRKNWKGWTDVIVELYDFSRKEMIDRQRGSAEFWGKEGIGCFYGGNPGSSCCLSLPYAAGKTKMHALDQAAREAIARVLDLPTEYHIDSNQVDN